MKNVSILHISDIHKASDMSLDNLMHSLVRDRERWDEEGIRRPDYIVLSGDVIQGGETEADIAGQYAEAEVFLSNLCDEFLHGNRERMIIVPGNHDVSWPQSGNCMEEVEVNDTTIKLYRQHSEENPLRWKWDERKLFRINSKVNYARRFDRFVEFYNRFFKDIREFPANPEQEAYCIAFVEDKICFACFNSCSQNDHLNDAGSIHKDAIYSIDDELERCYGIGMLPIGVWHHNAYGDPFKSDYMSKAILDKLLEHHIKIGLFGHQHKSQIAEEYSDLLHPEGSREKMLLISSGTLFGGDSEQHKGIRRQYNIIEMELENGHADVSIHVREDENDDISSDDPYWRARNLLGGAIRYQVKTKEVSEGEILLRIDKNTRENSDFVYGIKALRSAGLKNEGARLMMNDYLTKLDSKAVLTILSEPEEENHCFLLIAAIDKEHDVEAFERLKNSRILQQSLKKDATLREQFMSLAKKF